MGINISLHFRQEWIRTGDLSNSMNSSRWLVVWGKLLNHTKNRTLVACALSNINKTACFTQRAQCVLLF